MSATQLVSLLLAFFFMTGLGGVLTAGLVMPTVAIISAATNTSVGLFDDLPSELVEVPLSEKSTIYAADGTVMATFFFQDRDVVSLDQVSQAMRDAVVSIEDHRFYEHGGIDPTGMVRALVRNAGAGSELQGGSTLTQQYVKNALIQAALDIENDGERAAAVQAARVTEGTAGIARKLREAKIAIALEQRLTKDEILERYLNIAQFGRSVYGVQTAAQHYFAVNASDLTYLQAATIAGVTRSPSAFDPTLYPEASQERRNIVLDRMHELGKITTEEYDAGIATPLADTLRIGQSAAGCLAANNIASAGYFCDYVTKIIAQDPVFGEDKNTRERLLYRGGLSITTTLDPRLQAMTDEEVKNGIPVDDPQGVATAMSVVQPGTGYVVAMSQNRIYNSSDNAGPRETAVNYNTDNKYGSASGFPPGSTFKPFTLLEWLKTGHSLNEVIDGRLKKLNTKDFTACGSRLGNKTWEPGNAEGNGGMMTVLDATMNSVNSAYLEIGSKLDLCKIMDGAAELGVHKAGGQAGDGSFGAFPANIIGSDSVAPLSMAVAFAAFASGGVACDPIAIISVVDSDGTPLPVPSANCRQALTPELAAAMNFALSHVWQGTASDVGPLPGGRPSAGKTGTTSHNEHTWFVGYTPQLAAAVWVGFADGTIPVQNMTINGTYYPRGIYGSTIAAPTWKRFMTRALEGAEVVQFGAASSQYIQGVQIAVPNVTGRSPEDATSILEGAGFHVVVGATEASSAAVGTVARTDPAGGTSASRGAQVTLMISSGGGGGGEWPGGPWPPGQRDH